MKLHAPAVLATVIAWSGLSFGQNEITKRCKLAVTVQQDIELCTMGSILCLIDGVNASGTSMEQQGCAATLLLSGGSEYKPPVPIQFLTSVDDVMIDGKCNRNTVLGLLFGKRIALLGNLPLLIAYKNTTQHSQRSRMRVIHDETDSYATIKKYAAMFGIVVSM